MQKIRNMGTSKNRLFLSVPLQFLVSQARHICRRNMLFLSGSSLKTEVFRDVHILLAWFLMLNCAHSFSLQELGKNASPILPKYPVVLVHGIIVYDRGRGARIFWGRIPDTLRKNGIKVFFGNTDSWGSYESNAEILKTTIEAVLQETKSEKVNIIAHSKGGIDSRYLIWKYDFGDKVASLTTISTPHHGSEIADQIYKQGIIHSNIAKKAMKIYGELYGDKNPDMYNVNYQLTTKRMEAFNEEVTRDDRVYYQSMYTVMNSPSDDYMFFYSYRYIKNASGENDGLVSEYSARWGDNITKIGSGISHAEVFDYKKQKISGIDIPDIYLDIVHDLAARGF